MVAWRLAWKFAQAAASSGGETELVNIYVVDDTGSRIKYYVTDDYQVFCPTQLK